MSDKKMYDILGKWNNLEPKLTKVDAKPQVKEETSPTGLKKHIQQLAEKYMGFKKTVAAVKKGGSAEDPEAVAAAIGRKKYGKEKFQKAAAAGKKLGEEFRPPPKFVPKPGQQDMTKTHQIQLSDPKAGSNIPGMKMVPKMGEDEMDESALQAYLGKKKYGEQGMKALQKAGREGASKEKMAQIRAKHDKMDEGAKPDFLDLDKDGNKKEPMKKAAKDAKQVSEGKMKDLAIDLKELSEAEFKKKYGKTKAEMRKSLSEARAMKDKDEFDRRAKVGDYYITKTGNKVTKTKTGIKHERGYKKEKDEDLEESVVQEKAKSKAQQKFMGMVYAAKKGEKPASADVAKAASGMSKKAAKDFAGTKHKGLPQHVKESVEMNESHDIRKHPIYTTQEAWDHYAKELAEQEMSAMEADMAMEEPLMDADHELDEIAKLAGLAPLPKEINVDKDTMAGKGLQEPDPMPKLPPAPAEEVPAVLEGNTCMECGMYEAECKCDYEAVEEEVEEMGEGNEFSGALAAARAAGEKEFEVDGKTYKVKESAKPVKEDINLSVSANGPEDVLAVIQKLAGMPVVAVSAPSSPCGEALEEDGPKERAIEYTNSPREDIAAPDAAYPSGDDLNRSKHQYKKEYPGDNPMAVKEEALWKKYESMIKSIKG